MRCVVEMPLALHVRACRGTPVDELEVRVKELDIPHTVPSHQVPVESTKGG